MKPNCYNLVYSVIYFHSVLRTWTDDFLCYKGIVKKRSGTKRGHYIVPRMAAGP